MERADEVPQTPAPEPNATERAALTWIESAMTHNKFVQEKAPSREASIVGTKLEEAQLWAIRDMQKKENN